MPTPVNWLEGFGRTLERKINYRGSGTGTADAILTDEGVNRAEGCSRVEGPEKPAKTGQIP